MGVLSCPSICPVVGTADTSDESPCREETVQRSRVNASLYASYVTVKVEFLVFLVCSVLKEQFLTIDAFTAFYFSGEIYEGKFGITVF